MNIASCAEALNAPRKKFLSELLVVLSCYFPMTAFSHTGHGHIDSGFLAGFAHPFFGIDHVIAMIAVGLWSAKMGYKARWILPITFPIVMTVGGGIGVLGMPVPEIETV